MNKQNFNKNIFNKTEYITYIKKNKNLTELQKNILLELLKKKFSLFQDIDSNVQISTYMKEANSQNNLMEINRLEILFMHFITIKQTQHLFSLLQKEKQLTDKEIINIIKKKNKENNIFLSNPRDWNYAIEYLSLFYKNNLNKLKTYKYIDICCGNGKKTKLFQKYLNINKEDTFGTDIIKWGPYNQQLIKFPFEFKKIENDILKYEDNTFDLATCILSLHHVKNLDQFLKEIYRILKPNGYLLLIEHSIFNNFDRLFINIQHLLYTVFYDKRSNFVENPDYIYGYNKYEWNFLMEKNKLKCIYENILPFGITMENSYDNIFYAFYKKIN